MINFIFAKNWNLIKYLQQVEKKDQQVESMVQPHDFGEPWRGIDSAADIFCMDLPVAVRAHYMQGLWEALRTQW